MKVFRAGPSKRENAGCFGLLEGFAMLTAVSMRVLVGISMLLVGVLPGVLWHLSKRGDAANRGVPRALLWGAAAWFLGVAAKFAWALPLNGPVRRALTAALGSGAGDVAFWIYIGLLTGVFECFAALLLLRRTKIMLGSPREVVAFGLGFGGVDREDEGGEPEDIPV